MKPNKTKKKILTYSEMVYNIFMQFFFLKYTRTANILQCNIFCISKKKDDLTDITVSDSELIHAIYKQWLFFEAN